MAHLTDCREFKATPAQMRAGVKTGFDSSVYRTRVAKQGDAYGLKVTNGDTGAAAVFGADGSILSADAAGWVGADAAPLATLEALRGLLQRFVDDPTPVFEAVGKAD